MGAAPDTSFLPEFCGARMVFVVVLLGELLAILLTLATPSPAVAAVNRLALFSVLSQWIALCCLATLCVLQRRFAAWSDQAAAAASYAATLVVTLVVAELTWRVAVTWPDAHGTEVVGHAEFVLRCLAISAITWALALRYFYVRHQWRRRVESEAGARFAALQARIRPHFLFNCMNTIAGLTRQAPALAEQAVEDLSDLLRASLNDAGQPVTLEQEIALCRGYLRIEQHRLGARLRVEWHVAPETLTQRLPALTLQPLLENAIYHGIERLPAGGMVRIDCAIEDDDGVVVSVTNPVPPAGADTARPGHHMARENVAQRLAAFFGRDGLLQFSADPEHYRIEVRLPREDPDR